MNKSAGLNLSLIRSNTKIYEISNSEHQLINQNPKELAFHILNTMENHH
jgi:5-bromo-4-chloroindolyl phosphate hydrolysis protein